MLSLKFPSRRLMRRLALGVSCAALAAGPTAALAIPAIDVGPTPILLAQHQYNEELLNLTNAERAAAGVPPLRLSTQLGQAAQAHAADMARHRTLSHQGSNGSSMVDRIEATGYDYRAIGENVA
ncbi:MAG: CAP domain-containing protein, partial [Cyanobacteria bacterium P01_A01_bin.105]